MRRSRIVSGGMDLLHKLVFSKATSRSISPVARISITGCSSLSIQIAGDAFAMEAGSVAEEDIGYIVCMRVGIQLE